MRIAAALAALVAVGLVLVNRLWQIWPCPMCGLECRSADDLTEHLVRGEGLPREEIFNMITENV